MNRTFGRTQISRGILLLALAVASGCGTRTPSATKPNPLAPGLHTESIGGSTIAYHVAGAGPIVFVHPGWPGLEWSYEHIPEVEEYATPVHIQAIGTGNSRRETGPRRVNLGR